MCCLDAAAAVGSHVRLQPAGGLLEEAGKLHLSTSNMLDRKACLISPWKSVLNHDVELGR